MKRFIISVLLLAAAETLCAQRVVLSDYAANKSGDDWAGAFAAAFAEGDFVYVPEGEYYCSEVRVPGGKTIAGAVSGLWAKCCSAWRASLRKSAFWPKTWPISLGPCGSYRPTDCSRATTCC